MAVTIKFFAMLKEITGVDAVTIEIEAPQTVAATLQALGSRFPELIQYEKILSFALNEEYVKSNALLADGDELALIPPISGG